MGAAMEAGGVQRRRSNLHVRASEAMDDEAADTLMGLLPPPGWSWADVATKDDLDALEERMDGKLDALEERLRHRIDLQAVRFSLLVVLVAVGQSVAPHLFSRL